MEPRSYPLSPRERDGVRGCRSWPSSSNQSYSQFPPHPDPLPEGEGGNSSSSAQRPIPTKSSDVWGPWESIHARLRVPLPEPEQRRRVLFQNIGSDHHQTARKAFEFGIAD